jgi:hypothetical protein
MLWCKSYEDGRIGRLISTSEVKYVNPSPGMLLPSPFILEEEKMSNLKFKELEESEPLLKRVRIEKSESMTEKDVEDFCDWVCAKATRLGFDVREINEDKRLG